MNFKRIENRLPRFLRRYVLHFEARIEDAVKELGAGLPANSRVLDAGAGEGKYAGFFSQHRYCGVDLAIGDESWNYAGLDALADLAVLPFRGGQFDASLNIVTLEHVPDPAAVLTEIGRVLKPQARLLLVVPQEWEVHQAPHDYFRFTRYGVRRLLERAGFADIHVIAAGGYFRLLSRRLLGGLRYFRGIWLLPAALVLVPPALLAPALDFLDRDRNFTLGYLCTAKKRS